MTQHIPLKKAQELIQKKQWQPAAEHCEAIIRAQPANIEAAYLLAIAYLNLGKTSPAKALLEKINQVRPGKQAVQQFLMEACSRLGEFEQAASLGQELLTTQPQNTHLKKQIAYFLFRAGKLSEALKFNENILLSEPNNTEILSNIAAILIAQGKFNDAEPFAAKASAASPEAGIHDYQLGLIKLAQQQFADAENLLRSALNKKDSSNLPDVRQSLAIALTRQGKLLAARDVYAELLQHTPSFTAALPQYALILFELGDFDRALAVLPQAIAIQPKDSSLRLGLTRILIDRGRHIDARQVLQEINNDTQSAEIPALFGTIEIVLHHYAEALSYFKQALNLTPDYTEAQIGYLTTAQFTCAFSEFDAEIQSFLSRFRSDPTVSISPFRFLSFTGVTADDLLEAANRQAKTLQRALESQPSLTEVASPKTTGKIRVGFLTNDFRQHATAYLMVEMLEHLNHEKFEWHAFSWGSVKDTDVMRPRIEAALDQFHDISSLADEAAAQLIKNHGIDVLIDLKGVTQGCRPLITARHPAKIHINWLGFPGSMGHDFADYIIVDPIICPTGQEQQFAEKVLRMPNWYMPSPLKPKVSRRKARTAYDLPTEGVVFGCFNQSYKITSDAFALWCRILNGVPNSVLWLLNHNPNATANLKAAAQALNVDSNRLIFADYIAHEDNLARLGHMDIMLDTFYVNGHTTTSDALSQGVPVITKIGQTFPSRVAASLLTALQLDDLICRNNEEYVQKAIELALDNAKRSTLRAAIKRKRSTAPPFNNEMFARDFEQLIEKAVTSMPLEY